MEMTALSPQMGEVPNRLFLQKILSHRINWSNVFKEISNLIPEQICFTEMNIDKKILTLKGYIKSPVLSSEKVLADYMSSLEKGMFKKVSLISTGNSSMDTLNSFELKVIVE